jgi:hypothetical protein
MTAISLVESIIATRDPNHGLLHSLLFIEHKLKHPSDANIFNSS